MGEDPKREGLIHTPERFSEVLKEFTKGNHIDIAELFSSTHTAEHDEMIVAQGIPFYSMCEHHLMPFFGTCHLAYIPDKNRVIGVGRLAKVVEALSKRLQMQEQLTKDIADSIMKYLKPKGVGVVVNGRHLCMEMLEHKPASQITTSAVRGAFRKNHSTRSEFFSIIRGTP